MRLDSSKVMSPTTAIKMFKLSGTGTLRNDGYNILAWWSEGAIKIANHTNEAVRKLLQRQY